MVKVEEPAGIQFLGRKQSAGKRSRAVHRQIFWISRECTFLGRGLPAVVNVRSLLACYNQHIHDFSFAGVTQLT